MNGFHEVSFPMRLARGAVGGLERRTDVIALASGREVRNSQWAGSRRRWELGSAISDLAQLQALVAFFEARQGRLYGFRFRDPLDHSSAAPGQDVQFSDQELGTGDGIRAVFQLRKAMGGVWREISKPVAGSVMVGLDGNHMEAGWALDATTGTLTFETPPADGQAVTAGFQFDCPVRFETDQIQAVIEAFGAGRVARVGLVELPVSAA